MHPKVQDGLLMSTIVLACLGMLELGGRAIGLASEPPHAGDGLKAILLFDSVLETRYRPNAETTIRSPFGEFEAVYRTNDLGLRDRPLATKKPEGEFRILAVGNSFVEGWGVAGDAGFIAVAESHANQSLGGRLRVVNAGISGYGAAQSLLQANALAEKVRADALVLFLVGTMVSADHAYLKRAVLDANGIAEGLDPDAVFDAPSAAPGRAGTAEGAPRWLVSLGRASVLARFAAQRIANRRAMDRVIAGDPETDLLAAYRIMEAEVPRLFEPTLRHVRALQQASARQGRKFALVHLPMPFQLSRVEWGEGRKAYRLEDNVLNSSETTLIGRFCSESGMTCLFADQVLAPRVARASDQERYYFDYDFHLNSRGNALVGEWLADNLVQMVRR